MKISRIFLLLSLISLKPALGLSPVSTYTFVDPCLPFATITPLANSYGCFSYSASNAGASGPNDYYSWDFGDGDTAVGGLVYHCYPSCSVTTIYTVTVGYNSAILCGPAPTTQSYTLSLDPPAQNVCAGSAFPVYQSALSVTVDPLIEPAFLQISYNFGDGGVFVFSNTHTYAACGNYVIQINTKVLTNPPDSCSYFTAVNLLCNSTADGIPTSILKNRSALLFPCPVLETLNISSGKTIQNISIVDITGRICLQDNEINDTQSQLNIPDLYPGVYFLKLLYRDDSEEHIKFIKK